MKQILVATAVATFLLMSIPASAFTQSDDDALAREVRNFTRVDDTFACAGATPSEAMPRLAAAGFKTIVNFRTTEEDEANIAASKEAADAAGLRYLHLPFRTPTKEIADAFLEATADPSNRPLFVHCASANRVGALWLIKRVWQDGWSTPDATREAEEIGLRSAPLKAFALEYLATKNGP